jgi:FkbM family methyltransferase
MNSTWAINLKKIKDRGIFYTIKIEIYKILLDQKYSNSKLKKIALVTLKFFAKNLKIKQAQFFLKLIEGKDKSYSQMGQDLFVLFMLNNKKNGFFIEVGAGDGINLSNTYLLEMHYNWTGILIEPNTTFYNKCLYTRKCVVKNNLLLNQKASKLKFYEKKIGEFSHSEGFGNILASDVLAEYYVQTIKFGELFNDFKATPKIDFLSIDTEGSEFEILKSIDFSKYRPLVICIEHNFNKINRIRYKKFLQHKGYKLKYSGISRWDSWFTLVN